MKAVADTVGVARSNLVDHLRRPERPRRGPYRRAEDEAVLAEIRAIIHARPTYGYRRVTALLNRARRSSGEPPLNHKRVFRLMRQTSLLLQPHTGRRAIGAHEGTVVAAASNQRWASDSFEIPCWNGEVVRVAFAIDTHDREVMAWVGTSGGGISGEMIRDMMLDCVERRFEALRAPHPVQWLADNGSAYTASETTNFAVALNLVACFTPVRSPESNDVCEAFVKTLKHDYVRVNLGQTPFPFCSGLAEWFEDYNTIHPHSGLHMRSPREFIAAQAATQANCPVCGGATPVGDEVHRHDLVRRRRAGAPLPNTAKPAYAAAPWSASSGRPRCPDDTRASVSPANPPAAEAHAVVGSRSSPGSPPSPAASHAVRSVDPAASGSAAMTDATPWRGRPAARRSSRRPAGGAPCRGARRASPLSPQHVLQHALVERQIRHQPFQLAFSSSSCFSLRISATLIPANCFFHR